MKNQSTKTAVKYQRVLRFAAAVLSVIVFPGSVFSQPPPPTGGSGSGTLPDSPLGVPFDSNMSFMLLFAGVVFAVIILKKIQHNKTAKEGLMN